MASLFRRIIQLRWEHGLVDPMLGQHQLTRKIDNQRPLIARKMSSPLENIIIILVTQMITDVLNQFLYCHAGI